MACTIRNGSLPGALALAAAVFMAGPASAQEMSDAEAMARALQDPLGTISALVTDNAINLDQGDNATGADFQLQPVYAIPYETWNFIPRGVIPVLGVPSQGQDPVVGDQLPDTGKTTWGLGDSIVQAFINPKTESAWKWGLGPQVSVPTHTDPLLNGPGWGGGPAAVVVGGEGAWAFAGIAGHIWGTDNSFSTSTAQPMIYYNVESVPGLVFFYNNSITYDWSASSGNRWTVPLGLGVGRTWDMGRGYGLDLNVAGYKMVEAPTGGPSWQIRFGISVLFPRG